MTKEKFQRARPLRVGLISLGCAKNLVDAEIMLGSLLKSGVEITNDAAQADAVIVNTCSFIDSAQEESVDTILESVELRDANQRGQAVIVSGCLSQRFREELPKLMPEVDAFMGIDQVAQVGDIVGKAIANRAAKVAKVQSPKSKKGKVVARLNELEKNRDLSEHEKEESLRGTEKFGKTKTVVAPQTAIANPQSGNFRCDAAPGFHPRFRDAAFPADAETFCLSENRRGLQPSVQLLHHSPDARLAPQPHAGGHRQGSQGAHRRRREGDQFDFAGLDLLRTRLAPESQPRDFVAGEIFRRRPNRLPPMPRPFARCSAN